MIKMRETRSRIFSNKRIIILLLGNSSFVTRFQSKTRSRHHQSEILCEIKELPEGFSQQLTNDSPTGFPRR